MLDTGVRKAAESSCEALERASQAQVREYLAAQEALHARKIRSAERKAWAAAAVGILCVVLSLAALFVAYASHVAP